MSEPDPAEVLAAWRRRWCRPGERDEWVVYEPAVMEPAGWHAEN